MLTNEQLAVINHDPSRHRRNMSAPGSGKTFVETQYVALLMKDLGFGRDDILVLMFNRATRFQFIARLQELGIPKKMQPPVHTFHSFSKSVIEDFTGQPVRIMSEAQSWLFINRAISYLERNDAITPGSVDPEDAASAIQMWKSSLIPPQRAGHKINRNIPPVYQEYENRRREKGLLSFDDFVPEAISVLQRRGLRKRPRVIITDEMQDISYSYMQLIQLLAGDWASVMGSGDGDQCIYSWNGARMQYILGFAQYFTSKPHSEYTMTRSFRFGPLIAQAAHNVIRHNNIRVETPLIAHDASKPGSITVIEDVMPGSSNKVIARMIYDLVAEKGVAPSEIRVLARTFSQLAGLEGELLAHKMPYEVRGKTPFFERRECVALVDYLRLAQRLNDEIGKDVIDLVLSVLNMPGRKIKRDTVRTALIRAQKGHLPVGNSAAEVLEWLAWGDNSPLYKSQRLRVIELHRLLKGLRDKMSAPAADVLGYVIAQTDFMSHFTEYYGDGYEAFDRKRAVNNFTRYARSTNFSAAEFIAHVERLDTKQGAPRGQYIVLTTGYREKGCQYRYVVIPECVEEYMPCLRENTSPIYDKAGQVNEPEPTPVLEAERRLFYVAITRAKEGVFIGTSNGANGKLPSRFIDEMELEPTAAIMGALQAGDEKGVLEAFARYGNISHITENVLGHYLPDMGKHKLADEIVALVSRLPERGFSYRYAYEGPSKQQIHEAWERVVAFSAAEKLPDPVS